MVAGPGRCRYGAAPMINLMQRQLLHTQRIQLQIRVCLFDLVLMV